MDARRLKEVAVRLRELYPAGDRDLLARKITPELIDQLIDEVTKGFGGDVGVVPRQFLRRLVDRFDIAVDNPEAAHVEMKPSVEEQRAAQGKMPIDYEPEADDEAGYPVTAVEL